MGQLYIHYSTTTTQYKWGTVFTDNFTIIELLKCALEANDFRTSQLVKLSDLYTRTGAQDNTNPHNEEDFTDKRNVQGYRPQTTRVHRGLYLTFLSSALFLNI